MRILLDTHVFFWWVTGNARLSPTALRVIEDRGNEVLVSAVVAWELALKSQFGKWEGARIVVERIESAVEENGFRPLPIGFAHARRGGSLPGQNRDPFDRLLAAQAELEGLALVTADRAFREFAVETVW